MSRPPMNELKTYVRTLRDFMRLQAWDLTISPRKLAKGCLADCHPDQQLYHARLRFADALFDEDAETQRLYITHELVHLTHRDVVEPIRNGPWRHQVGQTVYDQLFTEFKRQMEIMVDFNSKLIARSLPPPPWECPSSGD